MKNGNKLWTKWYNNWQWVHVGRTITDHWLWLEGEDLGKPITIPDRVGLVHRVREQIHSFWKQWTSIVKSGSTQWAQPNDVVDIGVNLGQCLGERLQVTSRQDLCILQLRTSTTICLVDVATNVGIPEESKHSWCGLRNSKKWSTSNVGNDRRKRRSPSADAHSWCNH